ncbi:MAG: class I SAM-dependent methyltransferase [Planctomycetota bacterium]|jgi:SAM-dependent methyltransferase
MTEEYFYDHFHQDSPTGIGNWITEAFSKRIFKYVKIEPHHRVLEIGPGRGVFADICLEKGIEYVAVEPNQQMAASLEKRGAVVICAMVPPLPAVDKEFDVVVMINVMEHMNSMQDALQIALQIRTVLKPKGKVVICSPDYLNLRHNFFNCDFSHNYVTTRRRLKQLLVSAGFNNIKSCYLSGPLTGFVCFLVTAVVSRLPFGLLNAFFPDNKIVYKLYKMQLAFSRKVLILAEKSG